MCGEHEIAPRLIQDLLEIFSDQADVGLDRREKSFFSGFLESFKKKSTKLGP